MSFSWHTDVDVDVCFAWHNDVDGESSMVRTVVIQMPLSERPGALRRGARAQMSHSRGAC